PFAFGAAGEPNVVLLDGSAVEVGLGLARATYVLFVHAVADVATNYLTGFADSGKDGNTLGGTVSEYTLRYDGGESASTPVLRRLALQPKRTGWGASPLPRRPPRQGPGR